MLLGSSLMTPISIGEIMNKALIKYFVKLIKEKVKTIEDAPEKYRDEIIQALNNDPTGPDDPREPTMQDLIDSYTNKIQSRLDNFARTRGYDGILSACSYAPSTDPEFRKEGEYCLQMRDITFRTGYSIIGAVMMGMRDIPTWDEIESELPVLEWPA